jgi:hypothetical protein
MLVFEVGEWWWWRHRVNTLKSEHVARSQGRRVVVMAAQRKRAHMLVVVVIEMPSVSRSEVVGAYRCWQPAAAGVLVIIMGDEKVIISRTSGCADTQVGAMERGR